MGKRTYRKRGPANLVVSSGASEMARAHARTLLQTKAFRAIGALTTPGAPCDTCGRRLECCKCAPEEGERP